MSSHPFDPVQRQIEDYSDRVFRGEPAARGDLDPSLANAIQFIDELNRLPTVDTLSIRKRKEDFMNAATATVPWSGSNLSPNGKERALPRAGRLDQTPGVFPVAHRIAYASIAILLVAALLAGGAYWFWDRGSEHPAAVPALQETPAAGSSAGWPMFRGNAARTGYSSDPGPGSDLSLRWTFSVNQIVKTVTMGDGHVFAATPDGTVYALDPATGEQEWARDFSASAFPPPHRVPAPVSSNGTLYVPTFDGTLIAVDAGTGVTQWEVQISTDPILGSPAIADGVLYLNVNGTDIVAVDANDGHRLWDWTSANGIDWCPPSIGGGKVFTPDLAGNVVALNASNGVVDWMAAIGDAHRLAAYQDGTVYVPGVMGSLYALDATSGAVIWTSESVNSATLNPIISPSEAVLGGESTMIGIDLQSGKTLWRADGPLEGGSPHAGSAGIYVGGAAGTFETLDLGTGKIIGESGIADVGPTAAISGDTIVISSAAEPGAGTQNSHPAVVRAYGPGEGAPNEVAATPPVMMEQSPPAASSPSAALEDSLVVSADLQESHTVDPSRPTIALAIDPDGRIWRFSDAESQVELYDRDENLLATFVYGSGGATNMFDWSVAGTSESWAGTGAAFWPDGTAHIADAANGRIQIVDPNNKNFIVDAWGARGSADGQLLNPADIIRDADGNAIIADVGRKDIQWFSSDGQFMQKLTGPDDSTTFERPSSIEMDGDGNLWVLDSGAQQLYQFGPDNQLLLTIGASPALDAFDHFDSPRSFAVDANGRIWVADTGNARVQVFAGDGTPLATFDACQTEAGCLHAPNVIVDGGNGVFFIGDMDPSGATGDRVLKFKISEPLAVPDDSASPVAH